MAQPLPSFERPPVIETALSVQFKRVPELKAVHLGLYWGELAAEFPHVDETSPLEDHFERFGKERQLQTRLPKLRIGSGEDVRVQMRNPERDRLIQVQNGRLVYNWVASGDKPYPRYATTRESFDEAWQRFAAFMTAKGLGPPEPNQWEVTYVNRIVEGTVWHSAKDWQEALPGLLGPASDHGPGDLETMSATWHFELPGQTGRLHIELSHGWAARTVDSEQVLILTLTARGPITDGSDLAIDRGLNLGHEAIVRTFARVTGAEAHKTWGRRA